MSEPQEYAKKIMRNTMTRDVNEVFPVKIGELRMLCEAVLQEGGEKPQLTGKQAEIMTIIKANPGRNVIDIAKALGYAKPLPLMNMLSQLAEKGYILPVKAETEVPEVL
ncbi:MAG: MarR family transcriptional regulator [Desulfobulbaceae bacterium]|nr:MarR family transcriptional regulator [Desulfobulbaceae bacterium]